MDEANSTTTVEVTTTTTSSIGNQAKSSTTLEVTTTSSSPLTQVIQLPAAAARTHESSTSHRGQEKQPPPLASVHVRPFRSEDANQLFSLIRELQSHECQYFDRLKPPDDLNQDEYLAYLFQECRDHQGHILLATTPNATYDDSDGELILGYAVVLTKVAATAMEEVAYDYGNLLEIAVLPTARRLGIGRLLLEASEQLVRDAGVQYFRTSVLASNTQAYESYLQFGMQDHLVEMEKKL